MLTILNDPAGVTGIRRLPLDYGVSLQANIERHLAGGADAELRINGIVVDPLEDPRLDRPPAHGDSIVIALRPRGFDPITWTYIAIAASAASAVYIYSALRNNGGGESAAVGKESPNNRLTSQNNVARTYQAVPDVYGYRRIWPDLIQSSVVEYVDHVKYVTEWLCLSRGKGTISQVQYADTPIEDIEGSNYEIFEPTPDASGYPENGSTTLSDVFEAFASDEVNGQELPYAIPFVEIIKTGAFTTVNGDAFFTVTIADGADLDDLKSLTPSGTAEVEFTYGSAPPINFTETCTVLSVSVAAGEATFTFSSSVWSSTQTNVNSTFSILPNGSNKTVIGPFTMQADADRLWWNTVFLRGLIGSLQIRAEWWRINQYGEEIAGTRASQVNTYTASTYDQRFYTTKVEPSAGLGRYRIQFTRLSPAVDANGADVAKVEEVYAVRYYAEKTLPGVTVARITTKATLSATGFSDRKFNARWLRHVRDLESDAIGPSRNYGRAIAHLWTVAGNDYAGIDAYALQAINAEHGEDSPLLRFDGSLDDADMSLGERMQFMADTARVFVWRDGSRWTFTRDQLRTVPSAQFDYRNLAGRGSPVATFNSVLPASQDGVEVEFVEEVTQSRKAYARYNVSTGSPAPGVSRNPKKVKLLGCATAAQADNRAQLEARRLLFQRAAVSDNALADATDLGLGALVRWVDPDDFGGDGLQAGEVMSIDGNVITTSEPLEWGTSTTGRMVFTGQDGARLYPTVQCTRVGKAVQLSSFPSGLYVADADRQCGSRYVFAVGLTEAELESSGLYTLTGVRPAGDGTVAISLASHDERIYEGDA